MTIQQLSLPLVDEEFHAHRLNGEQY